jgi:hypothetical protein
MVPVDHARGVGAPGDERPRRFALPSDVIAVLADEQIVAEQAAVDARLQPRIDEQHQRDQRRLRRIRRSDGDRSVAQIRQLPDRATRRHHDHGGQIAVGVAHRDSARFPSRRLRQPLRLDPRQRRVPCDVDLTGELPFDHPLVVRIEHEVERQPPLAEVLLEPFPDRDDLRVVRDRAHHQSRHRPPRLGQNKGSPQAAFPMKS